MSAQSLSMLRGSAPVTMRHAKPVNMSRAASNGTVMSHHRRDTKATGSPDQVAGVLVETALLLRFR